jgi:threonylcarbamoyladenosine tRNA methylthiotransferase MtaB
VIPNGKIAFHTLGCKLNFAETATIARQFDDAGFARVGFNENPDIFVINTCSVTDNADRKCRNAVQRALRVNPKAFVAIIGCYAQLKPENIAAIPGVSVVLGANEKFQLLDRFSEFEEGQEAKVYATEIKTVKEFVPSHSTTDRTRSFLKVQDGCNYFCAFCTIPLARGRSRSGSVSSILSAANEIVKEGSREIVLTGVNIGDFNTDTGEDFYSLIQELDSVEGVDRFRISSIEPNLLNDDIIRFVANSNTFMPHFHIPLQSGSDVILKAMRRRYLTDLYSNRVHHIKELMPDACIGVDVIVGFPGESDEDFETTYQFLNELPVSYLHVFTYSERNNTTAIRIKETVPQSVRQERSKRLRILSEKLRRSFYQSQVGREHLVLFEAKEEDGMISGFTENYVRVSVPFEADLINKIVSVTINGVDSDGNATADILTKATS